MIHLGLRSLVMLVLLVQVVHRSLLQALLVQVVHRSLKVVLLVGP